MPDLSNLPSTSASASSLHPHPCPSSPDSVDLVPAELECKWSRRLRFPISTGGTGSVLRRYRRGGKRHGHEESLAEHVRVWAEGKAAGGVAEKECTLPFLNNAPKMVQCQMCRKSIHPGEEFPCSVSGCHEAYHRTCMQPIGDSSSKSVKCPKHACFICKRTSHWCCVRCMIAAHPKCSPWQWNINHKVCWRHPTDWRLENEHADPTNDVEEAFHRLPLPYIEEEFEIGSIWKDVMDNKSEPAPYVHIKRSIYLFKRKRDDANAGAGCTNCKFDATCGDDCECRGLSISCSKACHCSDLCQNRPFRKEKKIKVVKTQCCGWGVEALESIEKGDFVIEYIGEVIDDALCEQRLWDMKRRGDQNFYMCEIRKDFTIDATFKGNASRFLNHSCNPNCKLEKWQVDGETRVGVFASRSIEAGEPLTYDYRFVHFGPMVKCFCGAPQCQGFLGSKRKAYQLAAVWGRKRKRTPTLISVPIRYLLGNEKFKECWCMQ